MTRMQFDYGSQKAPLLRMIFLGLVLISPAFLAGLNQMYVAVALPQMQLTLDEASWFGSLCSFSAPVSCIVVGLLIDKLGRRAVLIYSIAASVIGWSLLLWNGNSTIILMGQVFNGLTTGAVGYASQVYAGECVMVNHVRLRNSFLMWNGVGGAVGSTTTLFMATFINYRQICTICTILSIILLILLCRVIPESPTWLYHKGRIGDAEWSAKKLGIVQPILSLDPDNMKAPLVRLPSEISWSSVKSEAHKFGRRDVHKPVLIFVCVNVLLATCGPTTLLTYMINILQNDIPGSGSSSIDNSVISEFDQVRYVPFYTWYQSPQYAVKSNPHPPANPLISSMAESHTGVDPLISTLAKNLTTLDEAVSTTSTYVPTEANMYSVIIGILMCMTSLTSCMIIPSFGIRNTLTTSEFCSSFAFVILAFTTSFDSTPDILKWRVIAISMIAVLYSLSSGSSDAVLGDVLPADAKGFASVVSVCSFLAAALTNKSFPYLYAIIGGNVYLLFSIICILAVYFIRTFMPEVSGKTLDQITREFLKV